jgi:hypothetical protein
LDAADFRSSDSIASACTRSRATISSIRLGDSLRDIGVIVRAAKAAPLEDRIITDIAPDPGVKDLARAANPFFRAVPTSCQIASADKP